MGLETGTVIADLVETNPVASDSRSEGDDHLRLIKKIIKGDCVSKTTRDASGGYPGLTLLKLNLKNALGTFTNFFTSATTAVRTWTMPDESGTVALQESGTWTPILQFDGAAVGIIYDTQEGWYTKVGNTMHVQLFINLSSKGSSVGQAKIAGLPVATAANAHICGSIEAAGLNFVGHLQTVVLNSTEIWISYTSGLSFSGAIAVDNTAFSNDTTLAISFSYPLS